MFKSSRRPVEQPGKNLWITDEIMSAVTRAERTENPDRFERLRPSGSEVGSECLGWVGTHQLSVYDIIFR